MTVSIRGIGVACPAGFIHQPRAAELTAARCAADPRQARVLANLFRMTTVERRGTVLLDPRKNGESEHDLTRFYTPDEHDPAARPGTSQRMDRFAEAAPGLAREACAAALADASVVPRDITHLITVTCTGFFSPGIDIALIKQLGLPPTVKRVQIGFMGCHAALNALHTAAAIAAADSSARVLVCCVELCSLHFQYEWDPQQLVSSALFADGAAAMVVSAVDAPNSSPGWRIIDSASLLIDDTEADMTWRIGDHGFTMTLSSRVPDIVRGAVRPWLEPLLVRHCLTIRDIRGWAIHPGGPRIVTAVGEALGLDDAMLEPSRSILRDHGNMSSATVLFILQRLRVSGVRGPGVVMSFGPGLTAEAALLDFTP